jgi:hypothetical protein
MPMVQRIKGIVLAWIRRHPILMGIWLLFFALCIASLFTQPEGENPSYLWGGFVLPAIVLLTLVYMGRTFDRFRKLREYTRNRPPRGQGQDYDDPEE